MPLGANKAAIMGVAGVSTADVVLLSTQTASNSASLSFTSDITSTYGEYIFKFYNINPATDAQQFTFNLSTDGGSNYNVTKTSTAFMARHRESDASASLGYFTAEDIAQGTGYQSISIKGVGNDADASVAGELHLFNPSSTTYIKHFYSRMNSLQEDNEATDGFSAGYVNSTSAVNAVTFKMQSGNFDSKIKMWGVK